MGLPLNQSLSLGSSGPEVTEWHPAAEIASAVNSTIILIAVLTFALQLGLALYLLLRCWSYDKQIQKATTEPCKVPSGVHLYELTDKQPDCLHWDDEAAQSITLQSLQPISGEYSCYNNREYWDLLQR